MPHVVVKLWPGKSEQQKTRLAQEITDSVMSVLNYGAESVSVGFEEVESQEWARRYTVPISNPSGTNCTRNRNTTRSKVRNSL